MTATAPPPAKPARRLQGNSFLRHNAIAATGTWSAGVLGLLLQAYISHHFRPGLFGAAFAVFNLNAVILTGPAAAFGRMIAWNASAERARGGDGRETNSLLRLTNSRLLAIGVVLALVCVLVSHQLGGFLRIPATYVQIGAAGIPFMMATAPLMAALQGRQRWVSWSALNLGTVVSRFVFVVALMFPFGIPGVLAGISVGSAVIYLVAVALVWPQLRGPRVATGWRERWQFLVVSNASTLMMSFLAGSDVLLVQHFFAGRLAGQFSSVVITSRALYFGMNSVGSVLFPRVAARHAGSLAARRAVVASVAFAIVGGFIGLAVFSLGGHAIISFFSGRNYANGTSYSGLYAAGMPMLAAVLMLSNTQQTLADLRFLWVLLLGAALKPVLVLAFHQSLFVVSLVSTISIGAMLVILGARYALIVWRHDREATPQQQQQPAALPADLPPPPPPPPPVEPVIGELPRSVVPAPPVIAELPRDATPAQSWSARIVAWVHAMSGRIIEHPWLAAACFAVGGLAVRHSWLTTQPLAAGDWHFTDRLRVASTFPWPSIWDANWGLGGENRFLSAFRFPAQAVEGFFATLGASWPIIEKIVFFIPLAVLLPFAGWLLAREVMGRTRWTLLTPLLLAGTTYFLVVGDGEPPLALGEACAMLALFAFIRTMRRRSIGWAVVTGGFVALTTTFDVRPVYLSVLMMGLYLLITCLADHDLHNVVRRVLLGGLAGAVYVGSQAFWILPLLTYHGNPGLPIPDAPNFTILTLAHGIAGVSTEWTGGVTAQFVQAPLNPLYMLLPLLALAPLVARRVSREVVWLAIIAVFFAFMAKTNNPPLGGLYDWMYLHVPGWKLFREGSKFLFPVGMAYAILIPIGLRSGFAWAAARKRPSSRLLLRSGAAASLVAVVVITCLNIAVLQRGELGSTSRSTPEPDSFATLSAQLAADTRPGAVLWFGKPLVSQGTHSHHFVIGSPNHPMVNLTGAGALAKINQRDPFQLYCTDQLTPFCYLDTTLFPYLLQMSGAGYVVVPAGSNEGSLPIGVTRSWLGDRVEAVLGRPQTVGSGGTQLLVWRLPAVRPAVSVAPAVTVVDSGTWATASVLPALQALGTPTVYRQTFNSHQDPAVTKALPDSITVIPRVTGACSSTGATDVAVMAQSSAASLTLTVEGTPRSLPLLSQAARSHGWSAYGPISTAAGNTPISAPGGGVTLGPCVAWSPLAADVFAGRAGAVDAHTNRVAAEQVSATAGAGSSGRYVELLRYFDPGWRLQGRTPKAAADGLFNLYERTGNGKGALSFTYSTLTWEHIGQGVAGVAVVAAVLVAVWGFRRARQEAFDEPAPQTFAFPSAAASWVAAIGLALLAVTAVMLTLEWFGVPSRVTRVGAYASDPYGLDVGFGAAALACFGLSLAVRVAAKALGGRRASARPMKVTPGYRAAAAVFTLAVVLTSCGETKGDLRGLISEAQQAGSLAPPVSISALQDAGLQRAAGNPALCITDYTAALEGHPNLGTAFIGRGDCYLNGGKDAPAAVHDYTQAIAVSTTTSDLLRRRAVAERASGNRQAAVADYLRAAALPSATAEEQLAVADGLIVLQDYQDAATVYHESAQRFPQSYAIGIAAADLAMAEGDDQKSAALLTGALGLAHDDTEKAAVLGRVCAADVLQHRYQQATVDCTAAAHLSPASGSGDDDNLSVAHLALGDAQAALRDIDEAIEAFIGSAGQYSQASGVDGFGLSNLYQARGWIDIQLHRRQDALNDFHRATAALPGVAPNARARIKGDIADARVD